MKICLGHFFLIFKNNVLGVTACVKIFQEMKFQEFGGIILPEICPLPYFKWNKFLIFSSGEGKRQHWDRH